MEKCTLGAVKLRIDCYSRAPRRDWALAVIWTLTYYHVKTNKWRMIQWTHKNRRHCNSCYLRGLLRTYLRVVSSILTWLKRAKQAKQSLILHFNYLITLHFHSATGSAFTNWYKQPDCLSPGTCSYTITQRLSSSTKTVANCITSSKRTPLPLYLPTKPFTQLLENI